MSDLKQITKLVRKNRVNPATGKKASAFWWIHKMQTVSMLDDAVLLDLIKQYRKLYKEKEIVIHENNVLEGKLGDKRDVYGFVVQFKDESIDMPLDPISLAVGILVEGCAVWFYNKIDRDNYYMYITTGKKN